MWLKHVCAHVKEKNGKAPVTKTIDEEATTEYPWTDDIIDESLFWTANDINDVIDVPPEVKITISDFICDVCYNWWEYIVCCSWFVTYYYCYGFVSCLWFVFQLKK